MPEIFGYSQDEIGRVTNFIGTVIDGNVIMRSDGRMAYIYQGRMKGKFPKRVITGKILL